MRGYFGIGIERGKTESNYGTLFRTAQIFGAAFVFIIGQRFKPMSSDTCQSWRRMPTYSYNDFDDFNAHRPFDCRLIGLELCETSQPIHRFVHPPKAVYLLGAEDHGLTKQALKSCQSIVQIPGDHSLNVAVAGSIILYDRITKGVTIKIQPDSKD